MLSSPQIDWGDFTLEPSGTSDGAATGGAQDEIDWGITLEPSPQVTSGCKLRVLWGVVGCCECPPSLGAPPHWVPSVLQQDNGIDWGDGDGDGAQIAVLEAGTEGEHGHEGPHTPPLPPVPPSPPACSALGAELELGGGQGAQWCCGAGALPSLHPPQCPRGSLVALRP